MGGSGWDHIVPYQPDLSAALRRLQEQLFRDEDYYWYDDDERPPTLTELWRLITQTELRETGTHSILDVHYVSDANPDGLGRIRPLTADQMQQWFGTDTPTRADYERASKNIEFRADPPRWTGRCVVLYRNGQPDEIAFWGSSGD